MKIIKILKIKCCEKCPNKTYKYSYAENRKPIYYCGRLKWNKSKLANGLKINPNCPLEDYQNHLGECQKSMGSK
jgi:hypothetical protein